jgi:hypothetical protein
MTVSAVLSELRSQNIISSDYQKYFQIENGVLVAFDKETNSIESVSLYPSMAKQRKVSKNK